jgi:DNA-binding MarR family transcriptional regulator
VLVAGSTRANALLSLIIESIKLAPKLHLEGDKLTKDLDLSSSRWGVLGSISTADKPLTAADLARRMDLKPQTVQRFIAAMEKKRFITLNNNPDHKRARLIRLTKKGENALATLKERELRWAATVAEGIAVKDIEKATELLAQLRENITH